MIRPYVRPPEPPDVALLTPGGELISEHGELIDLDYWPESTRAWCDYDTVRQLVSEGRGEALCWNGEEITWRHRRQDEEGWKRRPTDVHVIKLPFYDEHELTIGALGKWRDWLASNGASPTSTTGSASWSLLRARLQHPLWLSMGNPPPLRQTLGGRQELGPGGQGRYQGDLAQLDLPAAYASELGNLRYGGHWFRASSLPRHPPEWWAESGRPVFCRAYVTIPEQPYGPLPRRPRRRAHGLAAAILGAEYPTGKRLQGVWTWPELQAAEETGAARINRIAETWVHLAGEMQPFLPWWEAIQQGRAAGGLAGLLAKTTGNALWGRFAMDTKARGVRTIRSTNKQGRLISRPYGFKGGRPPSHDLAETVSGRVRARLYRAILLAGDDLVSAHTDGIWCRARPSLLAGLPEWRRKQSASRVDLLDPQVLRYWPRRGHAQTVFAGVPSRLADEAFEAAWARMEEKAAA